MYWIFLMEYDIPGGVDARLHIVPGSMDDAKKLRDSIRSQQREGLIAGEVTGVDQISFESFDD